MKSRIRPIAGTSWHVLESKVPVLCRRGLGSERSLSALAKIADATNVTTISQLEFEPPRFEKSLAGVTVVVTVDGPTGRPLILTAWTQDRHGEVAALRAAQKVVAATGSDEAA